MAYHKNAATKAHVRIHCMLTFVGEKKKLAHVVQLKG